VLRWNLNLMRHDNCDAARWARRHPIAVALVSGLSQAGWVNVLTYNRAISFAVGTSVFVIVLVLWMPGGPLRRYTDRVCGPPTTETSRQGLDSG
jgi:hypothetical protein